MVGMSPPRHVSHTPHPLVSAQAPHSMPSHVDDSQLADTIHSIASPDLNVSKMIYYYLIFWNLLLIIN